MNDLYKIGRRPSIRRAKSLRMKQVAERRALHVRETIRALHSIESRGFVFTNSLKVVGEVIGHLKAHGIPYEYLDGVSSWNYAIRRLDKVNGEV